MKHETYSDIPSRSGFVLRWFALAVMLMAGMFTLAWLSASPAQATGNLDSDINPGAPELPDSDNLDFNAHSIQAAHFGIRLYGYNVGSSQAACRGAGRGDGFFTQADFPVASRSGAGSVAPGTCETFVSQQQQAAAHMASTGGYYLAKTGSGLSLTQHQGGSAPTRYQRIPSYGASDRLSDIRVDQGDGNLFVSLDVQQQSGFGQRTINQIPFSIRIRTDETSASSGYDCLSGFHPRGEDSSSYDTATSSGRKLNSLKTSGAINDANAHWCRSDARHPQSFPSSSSGVTLTFNALRVREGVADFGATEWYVQPGTVRMWGRAGCYYTALRIDWNTDGTSECVYPFPLPCDDDLDGVLNEGIDMFDVASWRNTRVGDIDCAASEQGGGCLVPPCDPPDLTPTTTTVPPPPGIPVPQTIPPPTTTTVPPPPPGTPPCGGDSYDFSVAENLVATSTATPGLASPTPGADLTVIPKNPNTASPPRRTTDAAGCPDGPETRLSPPTHSAFGNSAAPPGHFADYAVVRQNLAHRYGGLLGYNGGEVSGENTI